MEKKDSPDADSSELKSPIHDMKGEVSPAYPGFESTEQLRRVSDSIPSSAWLVAIVELCERFTYYGLSGVFQNYISKPGVPQGLHASQSKATALSNFFQFWCYLTPILGAVISDSYLGKYKTICIGAGLYVVGCVLLFATSVPAVFTEKAGLGGLVGAMIIIGLGAGAIKANVSPLIADQYTTTEPYVKELKSGEKVLVDPSTTVQRIFMLFYLCINIGSLSPIATTELEMHVGFWASYLLPLCFFFVGILALVLGRKRYVVRPPSRSVIPDAFKVCYQGAKHGFNLEKAKGGPWSDVFVDEVRRALVACQVFVAYPIYWVAYGQMLNNFISQASQMNNHSLPNDIMMNIDPICIIIFIPILDRLIYPALRRVGIAFKPITRIFFGFVCFAVAMGYAAWLQSKIYSTGPCYENPQKCAALNGAGTGNDVHMALQTPAYALIALGEIFASVTGLEYAYTKAPAQLKSFTMALFFLTNAFGSLIGMALSPTAVNPKLTWMYTGLGIGTMVAGICFWFTFKRLNKMDEALNAISR